MNGKKCIFLAVIFILLANQLSTAARPRRRTRASRQKTSAWQVKKQTSTRQKTYIKVGRSKARMKSRQYSPERLITNAQYRRSFALANGEKPKKSLGAYLTRQEKRGLQRLVESQIKIVWPVCEESMELHKLVDQRRYKQLRALLGKRYADRWDKKRAAQRRYWAAIQKEQGGI